MTAAELKQRKPVARPPSPAPINAEEIARRREAAEQADALLRIEGLTIPPAAQPIFDLWAAGQISSEEMRAGVRAYIATEVAPE